MKVKGFWYDFVIIVLSTAFAVGFAVYTLMGLNRTLGLVELLCIVLVMVIGLLRINKTSNRYGKMLKNASLKMDYSKPKVLSELPYPCCVVNGETGLINWCNESFSQKIFGQNITQDSYIDAVTENKPSRADNFIKAGDNYYCIYTLDYTDKGELYRVFNFIDTTRLKETESRYIASRPYVIVIETDNIDDSRSDYRDSEKNELKSRIESMTDDWCDKYGSVSKKISDDRIMIVTEKSNVDKMREDKFSILTDVRKLEYKGNAANLTLSVGVSGGEDIKQAEIGARKAINMALGRGGDQVAILKENGEYEFIGGVSASAEKNSQTKSKINANKLISLINDSTNVIICGHKFSDYDAIGAAVGVAHIVKTKNIPVFIAVDESKSLAGKLIERLKQKGYGDLIIGKDEAERLAGKNTLFVIVDTHIPQNCDYPEVFEKCGKYIIIDHHRLVANAKEGDKFLLHNPLASSTCEMVTEYLQHLVDDNFIPSVIAEALLSGIMLDTKNFVSNVGVRTFRAAAYLRQRNVDLVAVKKLFSNSLEVTKIKSHVISSAEVYKNCALSFVEDGTESPRIIAAQAADDLLNTSGIKASFVFFNDGAACASARSLGDINVQLIMEAVGGGGHQTMAACRLNDISTEELKQKITDLIDNLSGKENE